MLSGSFHRSIFGFRFVLRGGVNGMKFSSTKEYKY